MEKKEEWGGKRKGAGRKPSGGTKPVRGLRLSDAEYEQVKEFVKKIRSKDK